MSPEQLPPAELLYRYDSASLSLALSGDLDRPAKRDEWMILHGEMLRRLELAWHEDASGQ